MIDLKQFREHPERYERAAKLKNVAVDWAAVRRWDDENRRLLQQINDQRAQRKAESKSKPTPAEMQRLKEVGDNLKTLTERQSGLQAELDRQLARIPNPPSDDTPVGVDETGNTVLREVGAKRQFPFTPKEHWQIGEALGVLNLQRAAAVAGTRFYYVMGDLVKLQFGLIQLALSVVTDEERLRRIAAAAGLTVPTKPFIPVVPPVLMRPDVMQKMARLEPKEERYHIPSDDLYLVGSAEHTLGPLHMGETIAEEQLPIRYVGYSTSFRREAGSYGRDTKGMLRVHQFDKLEFETFCVPEQSTQEQEFLVALQEHLLQALELPYRVVLVCTGDMGGPDARQIDLETWMPGQGKYRETHSADLTTDYQARRLQIRVKRKNGAMQLVHMNDATAYAMSRTLAAIMENYQQADGTIAVPEALQPFMVGGRETVGKI